MHATNFPAATETRSRLSLWSVAIGAAAFVTMFFSPLGLLGAAAVIPGVLAIRAGTRDRIWAILGMVLGVSATVLTVGWLIGGGQ